ncbi:MAG: SBBP repeat-containing protein [bacterium]
MRVYFIQLLTISILYTIIFIYSCKSKGIKFFGFNNFSYTPAIGKVSNTFGNPLGRDIDSDGDNDSAVVLHNIAGGNGNDYSASIYVDQNGKIYITGISWNGPNYDLIVTRLNSDGSLDATFDTDGKVVLHNIAGGNTDDRGHSIYVDQSGKVYVTGYSNGSGTSIGLIVVKIE